MDALEARIAKLEALLNGVTRSNNTITFSGVNVQVVSGSGATDGAVNGLGNLIVGYNELRAFDDDRTGSHNIVVGKAHNFSSYGGMVVGFWSTISGKYATVSGGDTNEAIGDYSHVSGGSSNNSIGKWSNVSGGYINEASGSYSSICGGSMNVASGSTSSVSGGNWHTASGASSSISGGSNRIASGGSDWVAGGLFQDQ